MIAARFVTICPGCANRIEPGDMIGQIQLAYYCSDCLTPDRRPLDPVAL